MSLFSDRSHARSHQDLADCDKVDAIDGGVYSEGDEGRDDEENDSENDEHVVFSKWVRRRSRQKCCRSKLALRSSRSSLPLNAVRAASTSTTVKTTPIKSTTDHTRWPVPRRRAPPKSPPSVTPSASGESDPRAHDGWNVELAADAPHTRGTGVSAIAVDPSVSGSWSAPQGTSSHRRPRTRLAQEYRSTGPTI